MIICLIVYCCSFSNSEAILYDFDSIGKIHGIWDSILFICSLLLLLHIINFFYFSSNKIVEQIVCVMSIHFTVYNPIFRMSFEID